jgi:plastocyanin
VRKSVLAALAALLLIPMPTASAATATVVVKNYSFTPSALTVPMGGTVMWSFQSEHTTTSNQGFWDSGMRAGGQSYTVPFPSAGIFTYHCSMHPSMTGSVSVRLVLQPTPHGFFVKWSTAPGGPHRVFDAQWRLASSNTWITFARRTTQPGLMFPSHTAGTYVVRVRTDNPITGQNSGWIGQGINQGMT